VGYTLRCADNHPKHNRGLGMKLICSATLLCVQPCLIYVSHCFHACYKIAQFNFKVLRQSSFTGGISVVPNVSDKRRLNLTAQVFSYQDRDHCGEAATRDVPGRPRLDPYSKSGDGWTPLWESCQRRAGGSDEATAGDRQGSPRLGENDESESGLRLVLLMDESQIIIDRKGDQNARDIAYGEIMFRPFLICNRALCSEGSPNPLESMRLDLPRPEGRAPTL
jgi:hypothetical protein